MKHKKNISVGIAKIFPKYESFIKDLKKDSADSPIVFLAENYSEVFLHAYCQIDIYDYDGDILLSNSRHLEHSNNYNILKDPRLEYAEIEEKYSQALDGNLVYLPAVEYYINATEILWLEMKLIPVFNKGNKHIVCLSYDISRFKKREFEFLKTMANQTNSLQTKKLDLISDHISFLKYFIKMIPIDLAIYNSDKKILCSNYQIKKSLLEDTFKSQLAPQDTQMHQFDYLGNKLYVKFNTPLSGSVSNNNDVHCITDLEGTILDISDSVETHWGESKSKLIGNNILNFYQFPKERESLIDKIKHEKSISDYSISFKHKQGSVKKHKTSIKLIEKDQKKYLLSTISPEDLSSVQMEKTFRNEELLQETQRFSKTGSWSFDLLTSEFLFSAELERIFDLKEPCRSIQCLFKSVSVKDKISTLRFFSKLEKEEGTHKLECRLITSDCVKKIIYSEGKLERDYYGNPKRIVGFTQDISELRKHEEEKDVAKNEIDSLYNSIPTMLLNTDKKYRITAVSKYLLDKLGYCKAVLQEKHLNDIILDSGMQLQLKQYRETITRDADIINADGNLINVRMTIAPKIENKKLTGYTIVLVDISDKVQINEELRSIAKNLEDSVESKNITLKKTIEDLKSENERNKKLQSQLVKAQLEISKALANEQESGELKSRFIDMISHEYRTPLTVIMSSAYIIERLADMTNDKKINKHIDKIINASNAMTGLLDSTLDMVFHNKGDYSFVPALFNIENCIEKVIRELEIIDGNNHTIKYINNVKEPILYTDLRLCRLSIYNVIMNSLKYSDKSTEVIIESKEVDGNIIISVEDFGWGIPECDKKMIFTPFYRGSQTGGLVPGTGLGLTVTKQCIAKINGTISYVTEEKKALLFT